MTFADGSTATVLRERSPARRCAGAGRAGGVSAPDVEWFRGTDLLRAVSLLNTLLFAGCAGFRNELWLAADERRRYRGLDTGMVPDLLSPSAPSGACWRSRASEILTVAAGAGDPAWLPPPDSVDGSLRPTEVGWRLSRAPEACREPYRDRIAGPRAVSAGSPRQAGISQPEGAPCPHGGTPAGRCWDRWSPTMFLAVAWAADYAGSLSAPLRIVVVYRTDVWEDEVLPAGAAPDSSHRAHCALLNGTPRGSAHARLLDRISTSTLMHPGARTTVLPKEAQRSALIVVGPAVGRLHRAFTGSTGGATSRKPYAAVVVVRKKASPSLSDTRSRRVAGPASGNQQSSPSRRPSDERRPDSGARLAPEHADLASLVRPSTNARSWKLELKRCSRRYSLVVRRIPEVDV